MEVTSLPPVTSPAPRPGSSGGAKGQLKNRRRLLVQVEKSGGGEPSGRPQDRVSTVGGAGNVRTAFQIHCALGTHVNPKTIVKGEALDFYKFPETFLDGNFRQKETPQRRRFKASEGTKHIGRHKSIGHRAAADEAREARRDVRSGRICDCVGSGGPWGPSILNLLSRSGDPRWKFRRDRAPVALLMEACSPARRA